MPKFTVTKTLELEFECEAATAREAETLCSHADDQGPLFTLVDCQYIVRREDGTEVNVDDPEDDD